MKKLLSIGLLLSLSAGSVLAMNTARLQQNTARLKDTLAVDRAKVAGYKAQVRSLTKPAQMSPVVNDVLADKEAKLIRKQGMVQETNKKLRANQAAIKKAKPVNIGKAIADTPKATVDTVTGWFK